MDVEITLFAAVKAVQQLLDAVKDAPGSDPRQVAIARTQFETAFLWTANAVGGESLFNGQ